MNLTFANHIPRLLQYLIIFSVVRAILRARKRKEIITYSVFVAAAIIVLLAWHYVPATFKLAPYSEVSITHVTINPYPDSERHDLNLTLTYKQSELFRNLHVRRVNILTKHPPLSYYLHISTYNDITGEMFGYKIYVFQDKENPEELVVLIETPKRECILLDPETFHTELVALLSTLAPDLQLP